MSRHQFVVRDPAGAVCFEDDLVRDHRPVLRPAFYGFERLLEDDLPENENAVFGLKLPKMASVTMQSSFPPQTRGLNFILAK